REEDEEEERIGQRGLIVFAGAVPGSDEDREDSSLFREFAEAGDYDTFEFLTHSFGEENKIRVTLTWTDPPGSTGSKKTLVNDLDLEVT
ncbi:unnamed protein product, partial [Discosporangium mesarthrocarpum]